MRRLLLLIGGTIVFWLLAVLPVRALSDDHAGALRATLYSATTLLLCVLPSGATLLWCSRTMTHSPDQAMLIALGSTGIRMFTVLLAGWLLVRLVPFYQHPSFWIWLVVAYLFTLGLETALLLAGRAVSEPKS